MNITSDVKDAKLTATVTIPAADVDAAIKKAYREAAKKYRFPGFRAGHAPRPVIDNMLGAQAVLAQATNDLIGANDLINLKIGAVFAAVLGHIFPIFAGFRGGKGVATLVGAVTGIYPPVALLCFGVWLVVLMISHYVSLSSIIAGCCFPIFTLISPKVNESIAFVVFSFATAILLVYTHRKNIQRLWAGTESKIYIWKPRRVKIDDAAKKDDAATRK